MIPKRIVLGLTSMIVAAALILAGFPLTHGNADARATSAPSFTLTIGGLEPVTGELSSLSQPLQTGAQVAVSQINKALKANGSSIKVEFETLNAQKGALTAGVAGEQGQMNPTSKNFNNIVIDDEHQQWPFRGEYWQDELGYYRFKVLNKCGR